MRRDTRERMFAHEEFETFLREGMTEAERTDILVREENEAAKALEAWCLNEAEYILRELDESEAVARVAWLLFVEADAAEFVRYSSSLGCTLEIGRPRNLEDMENLRVPPEEKFWRINRAHTILWETPERSAVERIAFLLQTEQFLLRVDDLFVAPEGW